MLFVGLTSPTNGGISVSWVVGKKLNGHKMHELEAQGFTCLVLQADGHELEWIIRYFDNIPVAHVPHPSVLEAGGERPARMLAPVQKWKGEFAQFIFDHLPLSFDK
jgi:hypothetical protein